ncbi:TPA: hypothetical protein RJR39_003017 [Burkholderia cenocepacia]|nr:hypothetical protein [Burkholderia cenocepacia]MBR8197870.1 hypothetical protein [Burkholderia cenocepacia]HDV6326939.1 hypothetical protein [Burkholderia cenocepacia]HDV6356702.1 hypothetical protein [Burkholderia cenocepacia]
MPDSVGMKASSTIGALSSYAGAASCSAGTWVSWAAMPCVAEPNAFDTIADAGAATLPVAAATPATAAAAAAVCAASPDGVPPSDAHCAVLASIERNVS